MKNFAETLPERLRLDYIRCAHVPPRKHVQHSDDEGDDDDEQQSTESIRSRRKSLTSLPESLTPTKRQQYRISSEQKLDKAQLEALHRCMPCVLYYDECVLEREKPSFSNALTRNGHIRAIFNQLTDEEKIPYLLQSVDAWKHFLQNEPDIVKQQIPTLHLLFGRIDDVMLYFRHLGFPTRPPANRLVFFNQQRDENAINQTWHQLSPQEKAAYGERLTEIKRQYYQQLIDFVEQTLTSDYMRYELFRNVKFAIKDYQLASKDPNLEKTTRRTCATNFYRYRMALKNDLSQFHQIKAKLFSTPLSDEQRDLLEQMSDLVKTMIETNASNLMAEEARV
jgi:cell fate (sporulation/competence/biofilm development) regulator YmcA (YheA/YmcA/DUF963 family)